MGLPRVVIDLIIFYSQLFSRPFTAPALAPASVIVDVVVLSPTNLPYRRSLRL